MTWDRGWGDARSDATTSDTRDPDAVAVERYRYLLRTAPPEDLEQAHAEAFARLTPDQRRQVLDTFARELDPRETARADATPASLARVATRAEMREPGAMERLFGGDRRSSNDRAFGGPGIFGGGGFFSMLAGAFVGSSIANMLFGSYGDPPGDPAADADFAADQGDADDPGAAGDAGEGTAAGGSWDDPGGDGGDLGGDGGDFGGDLGGDFGGDFGDLGGL
jgi:hypothetical protein